MIDAYSYIRFSTPGQLEGDSLRRQTQSAIDYAKANDLVLRDESYQDLGMSAFKGKNLREGALGAFLKAVDDGLIPKGSYLLVENIDRLSRAVIDEALELFLSIIRRGIVIVTLQDKQVYSSDRIREDRGISLIISITYMMRAHEESATKSKRIKEAVKARVAQNRPIGSTPPWLALNEAKTGYIQLTEKVAIVRRIFDAALAGQGAYLISKQLNQEQVPVLRNAITWSVQTVMKLLHSESVFGRLVSKHGVFDDHYPAIIDKAVYFKVQELIELRNRVGKGRKGKNDEVANLFSGLCRCGDCGGPMRFVSATNGAKSAVNHYIECSRKYDSQNCPSAVRLNYEPIERAVLTYLLVFRGIKVKSEAISIDPTDAIRAEIKDKEQQIQKLLDLIESSGQQESRNLLGRLSKREQELEGLQQQLRNVVPARSLKRDLEESQAAFDEHKRLKNTPGPELNKARLRLQGVIKQFIERIDFPSNIREGQINKTPVKRRVAKITFRGDWNALLMKHHLQQKLGKLTPELVARVERTMSGPQAILYEVPKVGARRTSR